MLSFRNLKERSGTNQEVKISWNLKIYKYFGISSRSTILVMFLSYQHFLTKMYKNIWLDFFKSWFFSVQNISMLVNNIHRYRYTLYILFGESNVTGKLNQNNQTIFWIQTLLHSLRKKKKIPLAVSLGNVA